MRQIIGFGALLTGGFLMYKYYDSKKEFELNQNKPILEQKFLRPPSNFVLTQGAVCIAIGLFIVIPSLTKR